MAGLDDALKELNGACDVAADRLLDHGYEPAKMLVEVEQNGRMATLFLKGEPMFRVSASRVPESKDWTIEERWLAPVGDRLDSTMPPFAEEKRRFRVGMYENVPGNRVTTLRKL